MKNTIERWLGTLFGLIFVALSCMVAVETIARKLFNFSLQGADELGGYTLAVGATIAFSMALMGRTHIRVDVFHDRLPGWLQTGLNWLSMVSLAAFAGLLAYLAWFVVQDTQTYMSVSQTPWATPLKYPQSVWLVGLILFALVSAGYALRATWLLVHGDVKTMNFEFGPRTTKDEVDEELQDLKARSSNETLAPSRRIVTGAQK
jgi:TRAP-type C4-dicarboxylate transport system permease small subunit